jgi:hypothetical protein
VWSGGLIRSGHREVSADSRRVQLADAAFALVLCADAGPLIVEIVNVFTTEACIEKVFMAVPETAVAKMGVAS